MRQPVWAPSGCGVNDPAAASHRVSEKSGRTSGQSTGSRNRGSQKYLGALARTQASRPGRRPLPLTTPRPALSPRCCQHRRRTLTSAANGAAQRRAHGVVEKCAVKITGAPPREVGRREPGALPTSAANTKQALAKARTPPPLWTRSHFRSR